jgi:predicted permease
MNWWQRLWNRDRLERELDAELRDHFHRLVEDNVRLGMPEHEARRKARLDFGGDDQLKESCRDARGTRWVFDLAQDVRFAARLHVRDRWFTAAAAMALALGIGITGTMYTIVSAMTRGFPVDRPERIASIHTRDAAGRWRGLGVSYLDFVDFCGATNTFAGLAAFMQTSVTLGDHGRAAERASAAYVSANAFRLLGEEPILGRGFTRQDDVPGAAPVVILGHGLWTARYHADPTLIGRTIRINGVPTTVVAVMPEGFRFPVVSDAWQPLHVVSKLTSQSRDMRLLQVFGRLADGRSLREAQAEIASIAARLSREYPATNGKTGAVVVHFPGHFAPDAILIVLMSAVGFVLLVACANVANLLLSRSAARSREIALRASLGATRWRIVRQLVVESGLLVGIATVFGVGFLIAGVSLFTSAVEGMTFPYYVRWTVDGGVIAAIVGVSVGTAWLVGLPAALHVARFSSSQALYERGWSATAAFRRHRWTTTLLSTQLGLTLILLAAAGLMLRSFLALYRADRVVDAAQVVTMPLSLSAEKYQGPEQRIEFYRKFEARLRAIPGVSSVAFANVVPFGGGPSRRVSIPGRESTPGSLQTPASYVTIRGAYFDTLGIRVLRGRTFTVLDGTAGHETAIVNDRFATVFFGVEAPIGRRICLAAPETPSQTPRTCATVVGISPTVRQQYFQDVDPVVYLPDRADSGDLRLMVRADSASAVGPAIRAALFGLDPEISLNAMSRLEEFMTQSRWGHRVFGGMLAAFALVSLVLSAVGVYAVTAYSVVQRTQEIGVRMALGAQPGSVVWLFVKRATPSMVIGLAVGLLGALAAGRLLRSFLVETSPTDSTTLVSIGALLLCVAATAIVLPARRATRFDPVTALRYE